MPAWAGCRHSYKLIALNQKIMKYTNKILLGALAVGALSGCTDDSMLPYDVGAKPESLSQYEYLNNFPISNWVLLWQLQTILTETKSIVWLVPTSMK